MLIGPKERIVFFGDSLTKRTGRMDSEIPADRYAVSYVESYVDLLVKRLLIHFPQLEFTIYNRGVGGDTGFASAGTLSKGCPALKADPDVFVDWAK